MGNTFMKKLEQICCYTNTTARYLARDAIKEGMKETNDRIMRMRYMDALIDLARARFARNFAKAIEGNAETGIIEKQNTAEKLFRLKVYLEEHGMEIKPFMAEAVAQACIIYELGEYGNVFDVDEIMKGIYIAYDPEWLLYGIEELFWRFDAGEFVDVNYFDDAEFLVPAHSGMDKDTAWNQFAIYILAMLDGGIYMETPEYSHELDESEEEEASDDTISEDNANAPRDVFKRLADLIVDRCKRGIRE